MNNKKTTVRGTKTPKAANGRESNASFRLITDYSKPELQSRLKQVESFINAHPSPRPGSMDAVLVEACARFRGKLRKFLR